MDVIRHSARKGLWDHEAFDNSTEVVYVMFEVCGMSGFSNGNAPNPG
jgi:hypothetical protein